MPALGGQRAIPALRSDDGVWGCEKRVCQVTEPWDGSGNDSGGVVAV